MTLALLPQSPAAAPTPHEIAASAAAVPAGALRSPPTALDSPPEASAAESLRDGFGPTAGGVPTPVELRTRFPCSVAAERAILAAREQQAAALRGQERRLVVVVGPCSIHDPEAALVYAERLSRLSRELEAELQLIMRVYFEKPRTLLGWKGLINDPHLDGSCDIAHGLAVARKLLRDIAELGLPCATELLDPATSGYLVDLLSWAAVGARTTESPPHRELASSLSFPVGFKNATDGSLTSGIHGVLVAQKPHQFLGINTAGALVVHRSRGNPLAHLVLRGGRSGPNYTAEHVARAAAELASSGLAPRVMVDLSHGNSGKDYRRQGEVAANISEQLRAGGTGLFGVMLESNLVEGSQPLGTDKRALAFGQSITDGCLGWDETARVLRELALAVRQSAR